MARYDDIEEVRKNVDEIEEVKKFNPFHDSIGRFASSHGFKSYSANPKTKAGAMAIQRSAAAGHGRTLNVHRESKGESIAQNDNWLKTGQKPKTPAAVSRARYQQRKQKLQAQQAQQNQQNQQTQQKPAAQKPAQQKPASQPQTLADSVANVNITSTQKLALQARDRHGNPTNTHVRAVDHDQARVDGKDISKSFKVDMSRGAKDAIDQVAEAQGWKKAPTVTNDKDLFDKAAVKAGRVLMRTVHDDPGMTADQICTKTMSDGNSPLGGGGGKVYGSGMYVVDTSIKGSRNPGKRVAAGQDESFAYGDRQMMATVHPSARIATPTQAAQLSRDFGNLPTADRARFGYDTNTYIASKGYDGAKWHNDSDPSAYTTIFNQSALIFYGGVANKY